MGPLLVGIRGTTMKVHLTANGLLVISAESPTEAYALRKWDQEALVDMDGTVHMETHFVKGSHIQIIAEVPNENTYPRP